MTYTPNYQLNQWIDSDRIRRVDFNSDNSKIDTALAGLENVKADKTALATLNSTVTNLGQQLTTLSSTVASNSAALAKMGNCQARKITYTGNGLYGADNPTTFSFDDCTPLLVIVSQDVTSLRMFNGISATKVDGAVAWTRIQWTENSVSWYADNENLQMNSLGTTYHMVALLLQN